MPIIKLGILKDSNTPLHCPLQCGVAVGIGIVSDVDWSIDDADDPEITLSDRE